jgi:hypothetical protein
MENMAQLSTMVRPCLPLPEPALSAVWTDRSRNFRRHLAANTDASRHARCATRLGTQHSTSRNREPLGVLHLIRTARKRVASVVRQRRLPNSAFRRRRQKRQTPSTAVTAKSARPRLHASGSRIIRRGQTRIGVAGISRTPTAFPSPGTTHCYTSRVASALCAGRTSPTRTVEPVSRSGFRLITAMRPASCADFFARSAIGRLAF